MRLYFFIVIVVLSGCAANRVAQNESQLFAEAGKGKWWIINTVLQDKDGKDVHFNALVSMDKMNGKNYAACFASLWNAADTSYHAGIRNAEMPETAFKKKFPLRIWLPAGDSAGKPWSFVIKRNSFSFLTTLTNKANGMQENYTDLSANFNKQKPFVVSGISAKPQAWAVKPIFSDIKMSGYNQAMGKGAVWIRVFSDKDLLLKKSAAAFVHWLDLDLQTGKHLSVLFSTDAASDIKIEAALLWNEAGDIMARPQIVLKKVSNNNAALERSYSLYFSVELPEQQVNILLRPRMMQQEIGAKKNSFWMGAVEAIDKQSGLQLSKGNMYIFKQ